MGELRDALSRVREAFDRLERHAAQSELGFTDFARHLRFAERYVQEGKAPDASDMVAMGRRDLAALVREIEKVEVLPLDTAGLRVAQADLEGPTIELKAVIPSQVRDLAHEFAALAPDGGWVYLGVDDDGAVAGLDVATPKDKAFRICAMARLAGLRGPRRSSNASCRFLALGARVCISSGWNSHRAVADLGSRTWLYGQCSRMSGAERR
jgi:hypothetical protein